MKAIIYSIILICSIEHSLFSQNPTIQILPYQAMIYPNQAVIYHVDVSNSGSFNQQLFFNIISSTIPSSNYTSSFNPNPLNFPYTGGTDLIIQTNGAIPPGTYQIVIKASNGPVSISDTCVLKITTPQCYWTNYLIPSNLNVYGYFMNIDNTGNKWIVAHGLSKFDGISWTNYNTSNSNLPSDAIGKIAVDQQNSIWIPTNQNGLVKFDGTFWTNYNTTSSSIPTDTINCVVTDSISNEWIGTKDKGLVKFDGSNWIAYDMSNSPLTSNNISNLNFDKTGKLWMVGYSSPETASFIASFDGTNWVSYNFSNSCFNFNCGKISNLEFDQKNCLWFCIGWSYSCFSLNKGMVKFDGATWEVWLDSLATPYNHYIKDLSCGIILQDNQSKLPTSNNREILIDTHNFKWIATQDDLAGVGNGLVKFDGINWETFTPGNSNLPQIAIRGLSLINDTIWVLNSPDFYGWSYPNYLSSYYCNIPLAIPNQTDLGTIISISPNPAIDKIYISFPVKSSQIVVTKMLSITGAVIYSQENKTTANNFYETIDTKNFSNGIYFLTLLAGQEFITKKIVVNH